jgi:hypothetical protein
MDIRPVIILSALSILIFYGYSQADSIGILKRNIPVRKNIIVFANDKGEVVFNHKIHSNGFKEHDCILCHRTDHPSKNNILTRFDNPRIAHYFCKGCHREVGKGPTECHECHNYKKVKQ